MKAIINTKSANYKHMNGKTYEVKQLFSTFAAIVLPSEYVKGGFICIDFNLSEIIIVDIDSEIQKAFDDHNWGNDCRRYIHLRNYCISKKIKTNELLNTFA